MDNEAAPVATETEAEPIAGSTPPDGQSEIAAPPRPLEISDLKIGRTRVRWTTEWFNEERTHEGVVIGVIPPGRNARDFMPAGFRWGNRAIALRAKDVDRRKTRIAIQVNEENAKRVYVYAPRVERLTIVEVG